MKKVITYGTFDLFHQGHYNILKRAKEYGDYLIVGVTGENYDAERGKLSVQNSLSERIESVRKTGFADEIIVEEYLGQKISDILKYNIDTLVIGSDWRGKFDHLRKYCEVVYLERTKDISSTQIRENTLNIYKLGIVTNTLYDNEAINESKRVSGIHAEAVFSEDDELSKEFARKYELDKGFSNYKEFLSEVDIVYIKVEQETRRRYVLEAIESSKHVICDAPISLSFSEDKDLVELARRKNVILLDNVSLMYLQSFGQLSWMVRGNLIGDIVSIKCSISKRNYNEVENVSTTDLAFLPVCAVIKLLGTNYKECTSKIIKGDQGEDLYGLINIVYNNSVAQIELGLDISIEDGMLIIGREGMIFVPDNWLRLGYFKIKEKGDHKFKRYSYNFDGNGFRYLIQAMLHGLRIDNNGLQRIEENETKAVLDIINRL